MNPLNWLRDYFHDRFPLVSRERYDALVSVSIEAAKRTTETIERLHGARTARDEREIAERVLQVAICLKRRFKELAREGRLDEEPDDVIMLTQRDPRPMGAYGYSSLSPGGRMYVSAQQCVEKAKQVHTFPDGTYLHYAADVMVDHMLDDERIREWPQLREVLSRLSDATFKDLGNRGPRFGMKDNP